MVIEKQGLPNEFTQGEVGDIYIDTDTGFKFECTSKISIKAGADIDIKYIWMPMRENYKQIVDDASTALSEKLQTDVDKNKIVDEIGNIDVGTIVRGTIKSAGITLKEVVNSDSEIDGYKYSNNIDINTINCLNAISISNNTMNSCVSLKSVDMPSVTSIGNYAMTTCVSLKSINMPSVTSIGNYAMANCVSLKSVDMPSVTSIGNYAMTTCVSLKSVRLGANQVATLTNANAFANTPISKGTGYIYVPDNLVDSYKTATNWSVYADQIRPMSEYVEEVNE